MHLDADTYLSHIHAKTMVGTQFRSLIGDEQFWKGDVCVYLGQKNAEPPHRLWCYRTEKFVFVDDLENLQYMGVTNYPGKISIARNLLYVMIISGDTLIISESY